MQAYINYAAPVWVWTLRSLSKKVLCTFAALLRTSFMQVVMAWINACPESSTWSTLVEALNELGHRKTAQEVAERRGMVNSEPRNVYRFWQLIMLGIQGLYCLMYGRTVSPGVLWKLSSQLMWVCQRQMLHIVLKLLVKLCVRENKFNNTEEPPNKGHYGANDFVPCRGVVSISEVKSS